MADLIERALPDAIPAIVAEHVAMRESLPIGYLDMAGVAERDYPQAALGARTRELFDRQLKRIVEDMNPLFESALDIMAREFMRTALPPMLTPGPRFEKGQFRERTVP